MKRFFFLSLAVCILFLASCSKPDVFEPVINKSSTPTYSQSTTIGEVGTGDGQLMDPTFVIAEKGFIYVMDWNNNRIVKFTQAGDFVKNIPLGVTRVAYDPYSFAFGSNGNLFALNLWSYHLYEYSKAGNLITDHGIIANDPAKKAKGYNLKAMTADKNGYLYILNVNGSIYKHDLQGNFIKDIGGYGSENGKFLYPFGIAYGPDGLLYVVDSSRLDVQALSTKGKFIRKWGDDTIFSYPTAIGIDKVGYVYIADSINHEVMKFKPTGELVTKWDIPIITRNGATYYGITIDDNFNVYVTDINNDIVHVFSPK